MALGGLNCQRKKESGEEMGSVWDSGFKAVYAVAVHTVHFRSCNVSTRLGHIDIFLEQPQYLSLVNGTALQCYM